MEPLGKSQVRREILRAFAASPDLETHPRELARTLGRAAPPVVRELGRLEEGGLLVSNRVGPLRRYRLADASRAHQVAVLLEEDARPVGTDIADGRSHDGRLLRLHERIADRLRHDPKGVIDKARSNLEHWAELDPQGNAPWIRAWSEILDQSPAEVALLLVDTGERMRELRQSAPFAGVLPLRERLDVVRETSLRPTR